MLLALLPYVALAQLQTPTPSFPETVLRNFAAWDSNRDSVLSPAEIDRAALDSRNHGPEAAALAALHSWLIVAPEPAPTLNRDWFASYRPIRFQPTKGATPYETKQARKAFATTPGSLQSSFATSLRRLSRASGDRALFDADGPSLNDIHQGALGDCYMLAPLGALVHRNPEDIRRMIVKDANGFKVRFADGQEVRVDPLTDTELAMGGSATRDGYWIRVIEKAYGSRKLSDGDAALATDTMHGGSSSVAGHAFTGHKFSSISLVGDFKKEVSADLLASKMKQLRAEIPPAAAQKRLMTAGTPKKDMPRSVSPNHAYAVFGYDPATDRITLWNPHGKDFTPRGPEGVDNGYKIVDGVFSMPLEMFVRTFGRILFENP